MVRPGAPVHGDDPDAVIQHPQQARLFIKHHSMKGTLEMAEAAFTLALPQLGKTTGCQLSVGLGMKTVPVKGQVQGALLAI